MDPYQVLGIRPDADTGQIRAAYRGRARYVHPDAGGDGDAFTRLQDAYRQALRLRSARRSAPPPRPSSSPPPGRPRSGSVAARLWARHQLSVVAMLATQVVALSTVVLAGPMSSPGAALVAALLAGVGAGYAVYVVGEVERWLSWRERAGPATPRSRWWRASGRSPR